MCIVWQRRSKKFVLLEPRTISCAHSYLYWYGAHTDSESVSEWKRLPSSFAIDSNSTHRFSYFYSFYTYRSIALCICGSAFTQCAVSIGRSMLQQQNQKRYIRMLWHLVYVLLCTMEECFFFFSFRSRSLSLSLGSIGPCIHCVCVRACLSACTAKPLTRMVRWRYRLI